MKKFILILLILALITAVCLFLSRNYIAKYWLEKAVENLGVPISIENISVNIAETSVTVGNLTIYNPKGFQQKVMAAIPELFIKINLSSCLKGNLNFSQIRINISSLFVEKTREGRINLSELGIKKEGKTPSKAKYMIDELILTLGEVKAVDYSRGLTPSIIRTNMRIKNEVFRKVTNMSHITNIIINKIAAGHLFLGLGLATEEVAGIGLEGVEVAGRGAADIIDTIIPLDKDKKDKPENRPKKPRQQEIRQPE